MSGLIIEDKGHDAFAMLLHKCTSMSRKTVSRPSVCRQRPGVEKARHWKSSQE